MLTETSGLCREEQAEAVEVLLRQHKADYERWDRLSFASVTAILQKEHSPWPLRARSLRASIAQAKIHVKESQERLFAQQVRHAVHG